LLNVVRTGRHITCLTPDFCLIAMEPSVKTGLEDARRDIQQGYRNFPHSEEDFILHYCAYSYFCDNDFRYYITDISKGAMTTNDARRFRQDRYRNRLPLLQHELRLLGNPSTIANGISRTYYTNQDLPFFTIPGVIAIGSKSASQKSRGSSR